MSSLSSHEQKIKNGFTLVEVMVALVVMSVGMLGLASIQAVGISSNFNAYNRTIAMQMAYNMADMIRTSADMDGVVDSTFNSVSSSKGGSPTNCIQNGASAPTECGAAAMATFDIYHWQNRLEEELPGGLGKISKAGDIYTITVMWDEDRTGATGESCGADTTTDLKCYTLNVRIVP